MRFFRVLLVCSGIAASRSNSSPPQVRRGPASSDGTPGSKELPPATVLASPNLRTDQVNRQPQRVSFRLGDAQRGIKWEPDAINCVVSGG